MAIFARDKVLGSILAGAIGDALGEPVEFLPIDEIRHRLGPAGATEYGGHGGQITDDTQMTLFTLEGLIRAQVARRFGGETGAVAAVQHAYQRWLHTQGMPWDRAAGKFARAPEPDGWLVGTEGLFRRRAPGNTVMSALKAFGAGADSTSPEHPANDSKGCGAVMRAAPVALWDEAVFETSARIGALTHGHPSGYLSAGVLSVLVRELWLGADLGSAVHTARTELTRWPGHEETDRALAAAIELAGRGRPTPEEIAERLGGGWVGEEALAIGLCAALVAEDLADGLRLAVNHSGDSDSTGSICGNILGARDGVAAIPARWLEELELRDVIEALTVDALAELGPEPPSQPGWLARYPAW